MRLLDPCTSTQISPERLRARSPSGRGRQGNRYELGLAGWFVSRQGDGDAQICSKIDALVASEFCGVGTEQQSED